MLIGGFPSRGFPDRSFPDRAFPGYEAVTSGGGAGNVVRRYPAIKPKKKRTDEELILMFYAMIDEDY